MNLIGAQLWRNLRTTFSRPPCNFATRPGVLYSVPYARNFASKVSSEVEENENVKPKPKTATQLRRSASASLPIRVNPTPTRSDIRPVSIITTAERYFFPQLRRRLPKSALKLNAAWWIPKWESTQGKEGEVFIFENGSIVCWGLEETDAQNFARQIIMKSDAQVKPLDEPETEDVEFVTDPNE